MATGRNSVPSEVVYTVPFQNVQGHSSNYTDVPPKYSLLFLPCKDSLITHWAFCNTVVEVVIF